MSQVEAPAGVSMDQLTRVYKKISAKREEIKRAFDTEYDKLGEQMDTVKSTMLDYMKAHGLDSVKTSEGLVYRTVKKRYWTNDWEAMGKFVVANDLPQFYEKRLNQGIVAQFLEENPDVSPPGLNANSEYVVTVRKA